MDYYLVLNEDFAGAFTLSDDGYIGLQSVSLLNFKEGWEHTETILNAFPMGKMQMPSDSRQGDIVYRDKRLHMEYTLEEGQRRIRCKFDNFYQGKTFRCDITLVQPKMDTMVIATPWKEKKTAFSFEVLPPLKGTGIEKLYATIDTLREFDPLYVNITTHRSEYVYRELGVVYMT